MSRRPPRRRIVDCCEFCASAHPDREPVLIRSKATSRVHRMVLCGGCRERPNRTIWRSFDPVEEG